MEKTTKYILEEIKVKRDLTVMLNETKNLLEIYSNNAKLNELKEKAKKNYKLLQELPKEVEKSEIELNKIKEWLDLGKNYIKNNFKQEELKHYWFGEII